MKNGKLAGKVAVVTGASKGIGAAIAKHLAAEGASVVVNYATSKTGADKVVSEITSAGGKAVAVQGDVARKADIERLFAETKKAFGRLDILVNNAGIYEFSPLESITEEQFQKHFDLIDVSGDHGNDIQHWLQAEKEIMASVTTASAGSHKSWS